MESIYIILFVLFAIPAALLEYTDNACFGLLNSKGRALQPEYLRFRSNYVIIFSLMMAGDWLQGPYVYHLYEHYGFSVRDIGRLFIMGFGSSAVFGTLAGAMADYKGRKRAALLYVTTYSLSCVTKHSSDYWVLMLGRLLGGIATSLLFSAFESWAVAAHNQAGFDEHLLSDLFTKAVFLGNGVMAIASGLLGNVLVENLGFGPVAPFDAAIVVLLLGGVAIHLTWKENYGNRGALSADMLGGQFGQALQTIRRDARVALLGASQALFEASMYTFVFLWTPALSPSGEKLPHGFIFAIFMTASLVGTALAGRLIRSVKLELLMQAVFWCSAVSLFVPFMFHTQLQNRETSMEGALLSTDEFSQQDQLEQLVPTNISSSSLSTPEFDQSAPEGLRHLLRQLRDPVEPLTAAAAASTAVPQLQLPGIIQLVAFCVFEVLIGMFWPSMMTLRAKYVPEEQRSTIINVFRIPLNLFVCLILWKVSDFPLGNIFAVCSIFLSVAAVCQWKLWKLTSSGFAPLYSKSDFVLGRQHSDKRRSDTISTAMQDGCQYKVVTVPVSPPAI